MKKIVIGILVIIVVVLAAISLRTHFFTESPDSLVCHVGGTMKPVIAELARRYQNLTKQKIEINSAGSGELLAYIKLQKQGDVYVCHDPFLDTLMKKYELGIDGWAIAELTPVIVVGKGNPKNIKGIKDLTRKDVELILTDYQHSTLGRMLSTIFAKAGIDFAQLNKEKRIHTNKSGGYTANFVMMGNADAGMVWDAVAYLRSEKLDIVTVDQHLPVPGVDAVTSATGKSYILTPVYVTAATLKCSRQPAKAAKFLEYLASEDSAKVFKEFGFTFCHAKKLYENGKATSAASKKISVVPIKKDVSARKKPLKLYAGAGLRIAIDKLVSVFKEDTGIVVEPEYGGSGIIIARAQMNNDGDMFMPGDISWVEILHNKTGRVETITQVSYFIPVIIVKKGNPKNIKTVADFYRDDVSVGLGREDACQIGKISTTILKNHGLDRAKLTHKQSLTVNEIGVWLKMNDIDTGIVWDAIACNIADAVDKIAIPRDKNIISKVVVGLLSNSKNKTGAQKFIDFLTGPKAKKILNENGFHTEVPVK